MPHGQPPRFVSQLLVDAGFFFGGGVLGFFLAIATAPGSVIAYFLGFGMLPIAYFLSRGLWLTLGELNSIRRWILRLFSARARQKQSLQKPSTDGLPGFFFTTLTYMGVTALAGVLTAIFVKLPMGAVVLKYVLLGLVYGGICSQLTRAGYLREDDNL